MTKKELVEALELLEDDYQVYLTGASFEYASNLALVIQSKELKHIALIGKS